MMFVLLNTEARAEWLVKRREITTLARDGADPAEIRYLCRTLNNWAREQIHAMRGGHWLIPTTIGQTTPCATT